MDRPALRQTLEQGAIRHMCSHRSWKCVRCYGAIRSVDRHDSLDER